MGVNPNVSYGLGVAVKFSDLVDAIGFESRVRGCNCDIEIGRKKFCPECGSPIWEEVDDYYLLEEFELRDSEMYKKMKKYGVSYSKFGDYYNVNEVIFFYDRCSDSKWDDGCGFKLEVEINEQLVTLARESLKGFLEKYDLWNEENFKIHCLMDWG